MMNKLVTFRHLTVAAFACLLAASCSDVTDDGAALPPGTYPMTFTASVDGLTATRATTDNSWAGGEEVAIQIDGEVKKYTAASGGSLTVAESGTPFYWQSATETKSVSAWHSSTYSPTLPTIFSIQADQTGIGYQASDFLYAAPQNITFRSGGSSSELIFKHLPAKVVVNLKYGDGVTEPEVTGSTVSILNQAIASGTIDKNGTVTQVAPGTAAISPNVLPSAASGCQKSLQALLIPQQMQGKKFIKVTIGASGALRDYYYTPSGDTDANLEAGKQYTYTITVKKTGLVVESVSASWNDSATDGNAENATFKIHLADFSAPENTSDYKVTDADGTTLTADDNIYTTSSSAINISLSANENYTLKKFLTKVTSGICKQKSTYAAEARTYTYTFYDIHSDLWLDGIQAEAISVSSIPTTTNVGDYYYADGTWSNTYSSSTSNPCIGIVFKVGAGRGDNVGNYNFFFMDNTIHGYVVALQDAHAEKCPWGGDGVLISTSTNQEDFQGYSNTQLIIKKATETGSLKPDDKKTDYPAAYYISQYNVPLASSTSGWYFPSTGQLKEVWKVREQIKDKFSGAAGSWLRADDYLSSSEFDRGWISFNVGYVSFVDGKSDFKEKDTDQAYVRAILTF